jgi:hypothetical protein
MARVARIGRRQFLRLSAVVTGASLTGAALSACGDDDSAPAGTATTFRLSTRGERTCGACKAHGANRFYRTRDAADDDRAHLGCNCRIVTQAIAVELADQYFRDGDAFDRRWSA